MIVLEWNQIEGYIDTLGRVIKISGFQPEMIMAIARGGFIPARLLCDKLGVRKLTSIQVEYYDGVKKREAPVIVCPPGKIEDRTLVVDDIVDSGGSMALVAKYLHESKNVKYASLHVKPWKKFTPDYYAAATTDWIVYPWERNEKVG